MSKVEEVESEYLHRYVAQILLEAETPLKVGSGDSDIEIDSPVLKNWNGLPMVQGSSMAGVLRSSLIGSPNELDRLFGEEHGSRLLVSNVHLVDEHGEIPYDKILGSKTDFLAKYDDLPVREHAAISDKGTVDGRGKFDEEIVYAGSRFKFELELLAGEDNKEDTEYWDALLSKLVSPFFRLGGGSTKGFGKIKVISCWESAHTVGKDYYEKHSDLNTKNTNSTNKQLLSKDTPITYKIALKPADFFSFGAGFGDVDADDVAVSEEMVEWSSGTGVFSEKKILMPASSLKGALSHRVAFHYNKINGDYIETVSDPNNYIGSNNDAVFAIFGAKKGHKKPDGTVREGKGKALFSDVFSKYDAKDAKTKVFDHVKIDRFTGGAMDKHLYNEKVISQRDVWDIEIVLAKDIDSDTREAFELTLDDLCRGWLPLGGMVNRGHGVFVSPDYVEGDPDKRGWSCTDEGGNPC